MKTTVKNDTIIIESEVTATPTMADMLSADYGVDLTVNHEAHLILKQPVNESDIETQIKVAQETMRDMETAMLNKEVEEEAKKAEEDQKEVDEKWVAFNEELDRIVNDVLAKKYGQVRIAIFADNPTRVAYRGNMPPEVGTLFAFLVANNQLCTH